MLSMLLLLQITPMQPMPKGTALPPPAVEEAAVLAPITRLFGAMAAGSADGILAEVRSDGRATGVSEQAGGGSAIGGRSWAEFAAQFRATGGPKLEERLIGAPAIEIDGDIAMVWSAYTFHIDGKFSHCGTDHFDLVRENGAWKLLNITWTKRTEGCPTE